MPVIPDRTDKVYAFADSAARSLFRLVSAVLIARLCGPAMYAAYVLCVTIETVGTSLPNAKNLSPMLSIGPGLSDACRESFYADVVRRHQRWSFWLGLVGALAVWALVDVPVSGWTWAAFGFALLANNSLNAARALQQARFESRSVFWADVVCLLLPLAAAFACRSLSADTILCAYFATMALGASGVRMLLQRPIVPTSCVAVPDVVAARWRRMGPPMLQGSLANSVCSRVQPFVLQAAAGAAAVGAFGAAATTIGPMRMLAMAVSGVVRPRLALHAGTGERGAAWAMLRKTMLVLAVCGLLGVLASMLVGRSLVVLAFGADFAAVSSLLPIAFVFASLEAAAAILVVALQTLHPDGAQLATRLRIRVSLLALAVVWPACHYASAMGAFVALCATESLFLASALVVFRGTNERVAVAQ